MTSNIKKESKHSRNFAHGQSNQIDLEKLRQSYENIFSIILPEWKKDPNLLESPLRIAKSIVELTEGTRDDSILKLKAFPAEGYDQIVAVNKISFYSMCAHHFLPFFGTVNIAYIPNDKVLGLSKFARIIKYFSKRPQTQERLTEQITEFIQRKLNPKGVMVFASARHLCMEMRGIENGGETKTSCINGIFRTDDSAKAEAMRIFAT